MGDGLRAVHHHQGAHGLGRGRELHHGIGGAQDVAAMGEGQDAGGGAEEPVEGGAVQMAPIVHGDHPHRGAGDPGRLPPRHEVAVVLHLRDEDLVAGPQTGPSVGVRHEVEGFGGAAGEHDPAGVHAAERPGHDVAGALEGGRGLFRHAMYAAVHVGVHLAVVARERLHHRLRGERRGRAVQVDQLVAEDLALQRSEVRADPFDIQHRGAPRGLGGPAGRPALQG